MASAGHNAVVIGGGLGGLAAAVHLASAGRHVTLLEQSSQLGGKAGTKTVDGYRFDTGPSLLTMPHVFDELFSSVGRSRSDYITFVPLSPLTGYWFHDGTFLRSDTIEPFVSTLEEQLGVPSYESRAFFSYARRLYEQAGTVFLNHSLHEWSTYRSARVLSSLLRIWQIDPMRTMEQGIRRYTSSPQALQLFCRYATYNGSDPYQAPATLNNIAYVEHGLGGYAVKGGIYQIVKGLETLLKELGVTIRLNSRVDEITTVKGRVTGVLCGKEEIPASVVISDVDVLTLYTDLLKDSDAPLAKRYRRLSPSTSGVVFFWGMDRVFSDMGVHSIFFSKDYQKECYRIHREAQIPEDPTVYVNITSKVTPSDAPPGGENWFVLVNTPPDDGRRWDVEAPQLRRHVISRISREVGLDITPHIRSESLLTPADIARETGSWRGSLYGISSNSRAAAFMRHPNRSRRYRGLYLCGGSVHPGGGMPLALLSGKIAAQLAGRYS